MAQELVTILVPNYKTMELTKLCLRLIRKYTDSKKAKVIVIDNDSQDASVDYLKSLSWIEFIQRKVIPGESIAQSHARALDEGLERVTTPYVLSIHTDTLFKHPDWLDFLVAQIEKNSNIAGVGSWKLEFKSSWRRVLKMIERYAQLAYYRLTGKVQHMLEGIDENYYYLRSHCAMFRMDLVKKYNLHFAYEDTVACKHMHKQLADAGYDLTFLSSEALIKYLEHINHATMVLNPEMGLRKRSLDKGVERIEKSLERINAKAILQDASLDN